MLTRLVEIALNNRYWILGITWMSVFAGVQGVMNLPIDAVPDITNIQVVVNTKTGALDPEGIEILVTRPVEIEMAGIPGLEEVRSISKYGLSQVTLVFSDQTDVYWARQQVMERLQNVRKDLPQRVSPELAPITTGLGEVFMYSLEAIPGSTMAKRPEVERLTELRSIQDFLVKPLLKRMEGVADIDSNGGYQKEIHVNFFPDRLDRMGLTTEQLVKRLESVGENYGGGYIQQKGEQVIVRTVPGISQLKDMEEISLGLDVRGRPIRLKEVAQVREDHALRVGAATRNGQETVLGTVLMRVGANSREVAHLAEKTIAELHLPEGVRIVPLYSRSFLVDATISTVMRSLIEGAVLVIAVLFLLLGNFRASVMVALAIPISMLVAGRGMLSLGISGNLMSLGAIDFGLLVDGSVVLIENILSRMQREGGTATSEQKRKYVLEGASEVIRPVVFGLFMIMVVYLPILTLQGIEGKMFRPMAATVLMALAASLLAAVFVMPVLADIFLPMQKQGEHETWFFRIMKKIYVPVLRYCLNRPKIILFPALVIFLGGVALATRLGSDFIPQLDEGDLVVGLTRSSRIGINASVDGQKAAELAIAQHPEVETVFSRLGTPESATDPMGVHIADTFVILKKDRSTWKEPSKNALFETIREELIKIDPTQEVSDTQPIQMRFNEILEGSRADVTLRIFGPELPVLLRLIESSHKTMSEMTGVDSVNFDPLTALKTSPILDLIPRYDEQAKYGITLSDLNQIFELSMSGRVVGSYIEANRRLPVVVHLDESLREQRRAIEQIPIGLPNGGTIPLSRLAKLDIRDRVTTIARSWGERYAAISINLKDRDIASFVKEAQAKVTSAIQLPKGYRFYWGGQFKNLDRAKTRLVIIVPLTLFAVFLVLLRSFGNLTQTLLVFSCIPFATVGGIYSLYLRNIHFSVSAAVGFIALIGIALLNALVLMTVLNEKRAHSSSAQSIKELALEATVSRLRPVVMTALVASLGFLPMALNTGLGSEVQKPLATVVIGGLMTATLLTLLLLPSLFCYTQEFLGRNREMK